MHKLALFTIDVSYLNQDPCAIVWAHFTSISILQLHQIPLGRRELVPGTRLGMLGRHGDGQEGESHHVPGIIQMHTQTLILVDFC